MTDVAEVDPDTVVIGEPPKSARWSVTDFLAMPVRIIAERDRRLHAADRALSYQIAFLDDIVRAILPHDLILLGAPSGMGKTDMALAIAMANAAREHRVVYFALEAEPDELERRTKFAQVSLRAHERRIPGYYTLNFTDWLLGRCTEVEGLDALEAEVDTWMLNHLSGLRTFYRGKHFDASDLASAVDSIHRDVDLIVVDHLHYVDTNADDNEHRALGETVKTIRDVSLRIGKPILLVAHLRKRDPRTKQLVPTLDDFHGSSNITKIATQVITIERAADIDAPKWWLSPTFMSVLKDRRAGTTGLVALTHFDRRSRTYSDDYTLGRMIKGGTDWEPLKTGEAPRWARGHKQQEINLNG